MILEVLYKLLFYDFKVSPCLPIFQPVEVPLSGSTLIWSVSHSSWFCVLFKPAEGVRGTLAALPRGFLYLMYSISNFGVPLSHMQRN